MRMARGRRHPGPLDRLGRRGCQGPSRPRALRRGRPRHEELFESEHLWSEVVCLDRNQALGTHRRPGLGCTRARRDGRVVVQQNLGRKRLEQWETTLVPAGSELTITNATGEPAGSCSSPAPPPPKRAISEQLRRGSSGVKAKAKAKAGEFDQDAGRFAPSPEPSAEPLPARYDARVTYPRRRRASPRGSARRARGPLLAGLDEDAFARRGRSVAATGRPRTSRRIWGSGRARDRGDRGVRTGRASGGRGSAHRTRKRRPSERRGRPAVPRHARPGRPGPVRGPASAGHRRSDDQRRGLDRRVPVRPRRSDAGDRIGSLLGSDEGGSRTPPRTCPICAPTSLRSVAEGSRGSPSSSGGGTAGTRATRARPGPGSAARASVQVNLVEPSMCSSDQVPVPRTKLRCAITIAAAAPTGRPRAVR